MATKFFQVGTGSGGGAVVLSGVISPTQITTNTNNYTPTGLASASVLRLSVDTSHNLTGITGGVSGRQLILINVGSAAIVLTNDATSTAANRFLIGGNLTLHANESATFLYDATDARWRLIATTSVITVT